MWLTLAPGGVLLLGVPTCDRDYLQFPGGRAYGPVRTPRLLKGFTIAGRVFLGHVVQGSDLKAHPAYHPTAVNKTLHWFTTRASGGQKVAHAHFGSDQTGTPGQPLYGPICGGGVHQVLVLVKDLDAPERFW